VTGTLTLQLTFSAALLAAQTNQADPAASLTDAQKEQFLKTATIVTFREIGQGVTKPLRVTLSDGKVKHDASFEHINVTMVPYIPDDGKSSTPMHDSYKYNVAAYKIDRLIGLNLALPAALRPVNNKAGALMWWADNVQMDEAERVKKDIQAPNPQAYAQQVADAQVFDELIFNIDRNLANFLISKDWNIILIDHSRCFTPYPGIRNPAKLTRISRKLYTTLQNLQEADVAKAGGTNLTPAEVKALMARRDLIVAYFKKMAAEKGEAEVFF
jgi:hypothetical protein